MPPQPRRVEWQDYIGLAPRPPAPRAVRRTNAPDLSAWASALDAGRPPPADEESLSPEDDEHERFVTGFRLAAGGRPDPATTAGRARLAVCEKLMRLGLLAALQGGAYALTPRGREVADAVMAEL